MRAQIETGGATAAISDYAFDNRPAWFRFIWLPSDLLRRIISTLPFALRSPVRLHRSTRLLATCTRLKAVSKSRRKRKPFPLSSY